MWEIREYNITISYEDSTWTTTKSISYLEIQDLETEDVLVIKTEHRKMNETSIPEDFIQVGDIIAYHAVWFDEPVLHRVISINKTKNGTIYFIAKGDNNPVPDPEPVYQNQIVSKAVTSNGQPVVIPKLGYITLWIRGL